MLFDPPQPGMGDYHAHVFRAGESYAPNPRYVPSYDATPEDYLAVLSAHGLTWGTLVQPSFLGTNNTLIAETMAQYPGHFRGVAVVDEADPSLTIPDVAKWHELGFRGIRVNAIGRSVPEFRTKEWEVFLRQMACDNWHLELQVKPDVLVGLGSFLKSVPCFVVIDHFGLPESDLIDAQPLLELALESENIWVKASGAYRTSPERVMNIFDKLRSKGFDRIVPGSDWPHTNYETAAVDAWKYFQELM